MPEICFWMSTGEFWETDCDRLFEFTSDGPKENNFEFCPYCGKKLGTKNEHD